MESPMSHVPVYPEFRQKWNHAACLLRWRWRWETEKSVFLGCKGLRLEGGNPGPPLRAIDGWLPKLVIHSSLLLVLKLEPHKYSFVPIPIFNKVHFSKANNVGGLLRELQWACGHTAWSWLPPVVQIKFYRNTALTLHTGCRLNDPSRERGGTHLCCQTEPKQNKQCQGGNISQPWTRAMNQTCRLNLITSFYTFLMSRDKRQSLVEEQASVLPLSYVRLQHYYLEMGSCSVVPQLVLTDNPPASASWTDGTGTIRPASASASTYFL